MTKVLFLTTAETDLLTLSSVLERSNLEADVTARNLLELSNPIEFIRAKLDSVDEVLLRVVGGAQYLDGNLEALGEESRDRKVGIIAVSASGSHDGRLDELSTYPAHVVQSVEDAFRQGGEVNFKRIVRLLLKVKSGAITVHDPPVV